MSNSAPLFDGSDVVGITWGPRLSTDGQPNDVAGLRRRADQIEQDGVPEEATFDPIGLLRSAADELDANRAEISALKKGAATMSRKMAGKWFQQPPTASWIHFDVSLAMKAKAIAGAALTDRYGPVEHVARMRGNQKMLGGVKGARGLR